MHVDAHHENNNQDTVMDVQAKEFTKREETPVRGFDQLPTPTLKC